MAITKKIFKCRDGTLTQRQIAEMVRRSDRRGETVTQGRNGGMATTGQAQVRGSKIARWHRKGKNKKDWGKQA